MMAMQRNKNTETMTFTFQKKAHTHGSKSALVIKLLAFSATAAMTLASTKSFLSSIIIETTFFSPFALEWVT